MHLESRRHGNSTRNTPNLQNYGSVRDCNPTRFNVTIRWCYLDAWSLGPVGVYVMWKFSDIAE